MTSQPKSGQWSSYPHIPIYLEPSDDDGTTKSSDTISPVSPEFRSSKGAVHALAAASTQFTNFSRPVSPATQFMIWPIPEPSPPFISQHTRRPVLRFLPTSRPRLQFTTNRSEQPMALKPQSHVTEDVDLELGIENKTRNSHTIPSVLPMNEEPQRSSNIAQIIEQKLWNYNSSGNVGKRWLLEIISWWLSAMSMGIIIGVLIYYQDKKIPNWPGSLTLNAFIAILAKVSGAALILPVSEALGQLKWSWFQGSSKTMWDFEIFDNASRGPWGSFLLLIRTKGRALAAIGALITLLALALDPFFQQVVDFPERWSLNGTSSIPRVVQYKPSIGIQLKAGQQMALQDQAIQAVAETYFYENGTQRMYAECVSLAGFMSF